MWQEGVDSPVSHSVNHIYQMLTEQNSGPDWVRGQSGPSTRHLSEEEALWTPCEVPIQVQPTDPLFASGPLLEAGGVEWGQGEKSPPPFILPPRFSCVRCWRPVARHLSLPPVLAAESQCQASRLAVWGALLRGHLSKSWALKPSACP